MTSSMHHSYRPIVKQLHMVLTIRDHPLTLLKEKKSMKLKKSSITGTPVGLELSNISSNGRDTLRRTTPGSQLTKSMPHTSLKPITDRTHLKINGVEALVRSTSTSYPISCHVRHQPISQCKQRITHVNQSPHPDQRTTNRGPSQTLPCAHRPRDPTVGGTRQLPTQPPVPDTGRGYIPPTGAKHLQHRPKPPPPRTHPPPHLPCAPLPPQRHLPPHDKT